MNWKVLAPVAVVVVTLIIVLTTVQFLNQYKVPAKHLQKDDDEGINFTETIAIEQPGLTEVQRHDILVSKCRTQSHLSEETILRLNMDILGDDEETKSYSLCILRGIGVLDEEGNIIFDVNDLKSWLPGITDESIIIMSRKCLGIKGQTLGDTAVMLTRCLTTK